MALAKAVVLSIDSFFSCLQGPVEDASGRLEMEGMEG